MKYESVVNSWDLVVASSNANSRRDERAAEDLFRRKEAEAQRRLSLAQAKRTAAASSLNAGAVALAQAEVIAAQMWLQMTRTRVQFARFRLKEQMRRVDAQEKLVTAWINGEMEKGRNTETTFTGKSQEWAQISSMATALQGEVEAKGRPASWMSTEASANYSEAVRPQIAALQDLSISAHHSSVASKAVADVQRAIYAGLTNALNGVNASVRSFPTAHGTDEYGRAVNGTLAQLRNLNTWKDSYLTKFKRPINQISSVYEAAITAAGNLTPDWPSRSQHHVNESEIGDLVNEIRGSALQSAQNSQVTKAAAVGMQF